MLRPRTLDDISLELMDVRLSIDLLREVVIWLAVILVIVAIQTHPEFPVIREWLRSLWQ